MWHRLAHRVGRSSQATPAAVDKSHERLEHKNSDIPWFRFSRESTASRWTSSSILRCLPCRALASERVPHPRVSRRLAASTAALPNVAVVFYSHPRVCHDPPVAGVCSAKLFDKGGQARCYRDSNLARPAIGQGLLEGCKPVEKGSNALLRNWRCWSITAGLQCATGACQVSVHTAFPCSRISLTRRRNCVTSPETLRCSSTRSSSLLSGP